MSIEAPKFKLWLTIEVPGIYCDDFVTAAEDGFTPMDCMLESIKDEAVLVLMLHGDESGPELTSHRARIIEAHAEPVT